jgi:hypothetical protein
VFDRLPVRNALTSSRCGEISSFDDEAVRTSNQGGAIVSKSGRRLLGIAYYIQKLEELPRAYETATGGWHTGAQHVEAVERGFWGDGGMIVREAQRVVGDGSVWRPCGD